MLPNVRCSPGLTSQQIANMVLERDQARRDAERHRDRMTVRACERDIDFLVAVMLL